MGKAERERGKRGEREMRDILKGITGTEWARTPMSGALHTIFPWDIMPKRALPTGHIMKDVGIEVKNTETLMLPAWIKQCEEAEVDFVGFTRNRWHLYFKVRGKWFATMPVEELERIITHIPYSDAEK